MIGVKILEEKISEFNGQVRVVKSWGLGTYIQAGGLTQSGGIVKAIWKPTLKKIKKDKKTIKNCLILGLGGGTVATFVNEMWPNAKISGIDIDPLMVELGEKYLGMDFDDMDVKIADAYSYIQKEKNKYDLIIVDLYQGDKFPEKFEEPVFLEKIKKLLNERGIAVFNRLYYGDKRPMAVKFGRKLEKIFSVEWYYPEANLMLIGEV